MGPRLHSRGSPNKGTKLNMATSPLPSWGPTSGWKCYITPAFSGVPKQGDRIKSGFLTPTFSGAPKSGVATYPLNSRESPKKGTVSKGATPFLPSRGPTSWRNYYVTPAFSGVPTQGDKIKSGYLTLPSRGCTSGRNC